MHSSFVVCVALVNVRVKGLISVIIIFLQKKIKIHIQVYLEKPNMRLLDSTLDVANTAASLYCCSSASALSGSHCSLSSTPTSRTSTGFSWRQLKFNCKQRQSRTIQQMGDGSSDNGTTDDEGGDSSTQCTGSHLPPAIKIVASLASPEDSVAKATTSDTDQAETDNADDRNLHWILHFDINETILVGDELGGDTREDCFNKIIAKSAFCQITTNPASVNEDKQEIGQESVTPIAYDYDSTSSLEPTHWWDGSPLVTTSSDNTMHSPAPLYTGWEWPAGCCPYYRTAYKKKSKAFVHHDGVPYRPLYDAIEQKLVAPPKQPNVFHNILPAFFHTVYTLVKQQQSQTANNNSSTKSAPSFTLVFRTLGSDLPQIAQAMTAFANGQHPDYPDFVHPEYALQESQLLRAYWVEVKERVEHAPTKAGNDSDGQTIAHKTLYQYQLRRESDGEVVASGDEEVLQVLHDTSTHGKINVWGIRDNYEFWKGNDFEPWAGKPVWMTPPSSKYHHVLFDDNIHNLPHDGIAGIRRQRQQQLPAPDSAADEVSTGTCNVFESVSGAEIQKMHGLHLIRVPTVEPIMNRDWFLHQLDEVRREPRFRAIS